jgi:uncharacterized protein YkwD
MNTSPAMIAGLILAVFVFAFIKTVIEILSHRMQQRSSKMDLITRFSTVIGVKDEYCAWDRELRKMERKMLQLINWERESHPIESRNSPPLKWDDHVAEAARGHSIDMISRDFVGHVNPDGDDPVARLMKSGVPFSLAAENVARGYPTMDDVITDFMDEPPFQENHRGNILNRAFTHVGIGIVSDEDGSLVVTQDFLCR